MASIWCFQVARNASAKKVCRFYLSRVLCLIIITSHLKVVLYKSRMSVALMIDVGLISQNDIETCIDNSALKMSTDTRPLEDCPDCNFVPTGFDGCSKEECSIWHYR